MFHSITRQTVVFALLMASLQQISPAQAQAPVPQSDREVTVQPGATARLRLQSEINSKLSEEGDIITATVAEPVYVDGRLVLARGVEFHGRVVRVAPAKHGQRSAHISIVFENIVTQSGEAPIAALVTAIDDWGRDEKLKADQHGTLKGGHNGEQTVQNTTRGAQIAFAGSGAALGLGGAGGAGARPLLGVAGAGLAVGMLAGLLFTKGRDIRVAPGATLRITFAKPVSLPVIASSNAPSRSNQ
jgi:hypothetical protein